MDVKNFRFKDKDGHVLYEFPITGVAPDITVTASVDNNVGVPSVTVTKTGENEAPTYNLDFKNLKGDTGPQGVQGPKGDTGGFDINKVYPLGSIYMSVTSTNPSTLFGGTWEQLKDMFLLGSGGSYSAGSTGGEAQHTLTVTEMPKNIGTFSALGWGANTTGAFSYHPDHTDRTAPAGVDFGDTTYTLSGGGNPHNNMPPYLAVYMWKRTA